LKEGVVMSYSPTLGRWAQQDPMRYVDGMNLYEAYQSSPVTWTDWSGLSVPERKIELVDPIKRAEEVAKAAKELIDLLKSLEKWPAKDQGDAEEVRQHCVRTAADDALEAALGTAVDEFLHAKDAELDNAFNRMHCIFEERRRRYPPEPKEPEAPEAPPEPPATNPKPGN
jgi:hypothetical protein